MTLTIQVVGVVNKLIDERTTKENIDVGSEVEDQRERKGNLGKAYGLIKLKCPKHTLNPNAGNSSRARQTQVYVWKQTHDTTTTETNRP